MIRFTDLPSCLAVSVAVALFSAPGNAFSNPCYNVPPFNASDEILLFQNCTSFNTTLKLLSTFNGTLSLPYLTTIPSLQVDSSGGLVAISLPNLTDITTSSLAITAPDLRTLDFPSLLSVASQIYLDTPSLATWTGTQNLSSVPTIEIVSHNINTLIFQNLTSISNLVINNTFPASTPNTINLSGTVNTLNITILGSNSTTLEASLPSLGTTILRGLSNITFSSTSQINELNIQSCPLLTALALPSIKTLGPKLPWNLTPFQQLFPSISGDAGTVNSSLIIIDNELLEDIEFKALTFVHGDIIIRENDKLIVLGDEKWYFRGIYDGFPVLQNVTGGMEICGGIEE